MWRHGKILNRTIYEPNKIYVDGVYTYIHLYDKSGSKIAEAKTNSEFFSICKGIKWYLRPNGYVFGFDKSKNGGTSKKTKLHSHIISYYTQEDIPKGFMIDHIDGDPLNNTVENLRIVTNQENMFNIHKEYKTLGVNYHKWNGAYKWIPQLMVNGKGIWLGAYDTEEEATKARNRAENKYFKKNEIKSIKDIYTENKKILEII
jgi:hypothetical protein